MHPGQASAGGEGEGDARGGHPQAGEQRDHSRHEGPNREAGEPETRGEHFGDEQRDTGEKPNQPIGHMVQSCNPYRSYAIQLLSPRGAASMILRSLSLVASATLLGIPAAAQASRYVLKGDSVPVYTLAAALRCDAGSGGAVVVEVQRGGSDAAKLQVESGPLRGRETLRVIYPDDVIVLPDWGRGWNTT